MRLVGILCVVAILAFAYSRRVKSPSATTEVDSIMGPTPAAQVAAPAQPAAPATAAQPSSGLRQPIDRTRQVMEQVKQRNGNGEF